MTRTFKENIQVFLTVASALQTKGLKKKDIAKQINVFPSVYSTLINNIFPEIDKLSSEDKHLKTKISAIFSTANNISEKKIRREIGNYIKLLELLGEESSESQSNKAKVYVNSKIEQSIPQILDKLVGVYDCYYISTFGYKVKKEPFFIRHNKKDDLFQARKGNVKSPAFYEGFIYLTNNHLLTVQLLEVGTINKDNFIIHFSLPPSYDESLHFIKGIGVSMSNAYMPISRKIILKKQSDQVNLETYNQRETSFYECDDEVSEICQYFTESPSLIEYIPVPHPAFDESDLKKELSIQAIFKQSDANFVEI